MNTKTLLALRGAERAFDAPIIGVQSSRDGRFLAALTADGEAILFPRDGLRESNIWQVKEVQEGSVSFTQSCDQNGFLCGGEDGTIKHLSADLEVKTLHKKRGWIDCLTSSETYYAFSVKKEIFLYKSEGGLGEDGTDEKRPLKNLEIESAASGLAFDAKGRRLIASHYNGVSLWFVNSKEDNVKSFTWKGSHLALAIHPQGDALITAMQENELHGWYVADGQNMRMSGYPKKIHSLSFTKNGRWLATSGADAAILWPFFGGGPMGKAPTELARLPGVFVHSVCAHPQEDLLAIGYEDGTIVLAEIGGGEDRILPLAMGSKAGGHARGAVTSLAFTPQGGALIFGTEEGYVGAIDLSSEH